MLAAIGEFERDLIKERAAEGIARAKANGVKFGTKPTLSDEQIEAFLMWWHRAGTNRAELARRYGISRSTGYRIAQAHPRPASADVHMEIPIEL